MLQHLGTGDGAFLVDVANEDHWHAAGLGITQESGGTLAHLAHRAGGAVEFVAGDGLDGVDNHQVGGTLLDAGKDARERSLTHDVALAVLVAAGNAVGTHAQLLRTLLTADVEHLARTDAQHVLQHQRALSNAWLSANEHYRSWHQSTSQHTVQLTAGQLDAWQLLSLYIVDFHGHSALAVAALVVAKERSAARLGCYGFLDIGVPLATCGTFSNPLGRLSATVLAKIGSLSSLLCHIILYFVPQR